MSGNDVMVATTFRFYLCAKGLSMHGLAMSVPVISDVLTSLSASYLFDVSGTGCQHSGAADGK